MLTYRSVTYHEDPKAKLVYFFNESRMELCEKCPMKGKDGVLKVDENTTIESLLGCPCDMLRQVASGVISMDAYLAIREAGMFDDFVDNVKANDMPIGGVDLESLMKTK